jgi:hypothetical protein
LSGHPSPALTAPKCPNPLCHQEEESLGTENNIELVHFAAPCLTPLSPPLMTPTGGRVPTAPGTWSKPGLLGAARGDFSLSLSRNRGGRCRVPPIPLERRAIARTRSDLGSNGGRSVACILKTGGIGGSPEGGSGPTLRRGIGRGVRPWGEDPEGGSDPGETRGLCDVDRDGSLVPFDVSCRLSQVRHTSQWKETCGHKAVGQK